MKKLKYAVEIEIEDNLYTLMDAASHYGNCPITAHEALRQVVEDMLNDLADGPNSFNATVTYIEQEEQ